MNFICVCLKIKHYFFSRYLTYPLPLAVTTWLPSNFRSLIHHKDKSVVTLIIITLWVIWRSYIDSVKLEYGINLFHFVCHKVCRMITWPLLTAGRLADWPSATIRREPSIDATSGSVAEKCRIYHCSVAIAIPTNQLTISFRPIGASRLYFV